MGWWDIEAEKLQREVIRQDQSTADLPLFEDSKGVRRAIVHTRQDMVMVISLLSSLNRQIRTLKIIGTLIIVALVVIAVRI